MKKLIIPLVALLTVLAVLPLSVFSIQAESEDVSETESKSQEKTDKESEKESESSKPQQDPDKILVTMGYLEAFKEEIKAEIKAELIEEGLSSGAGYEDVKATRGQVIRLYADSEIIYRGGGASVVSSSNIPGDGVSDMSNGKELFSGEPLEYGHIYFPSEGESKKAFVITGEVAHFTIRGNYEIG